MSPSCPISNKRIDTNLVRVVSFQVLLFTVLFSVTHSLVFVFVILFDFMMRVFRKEKFSPFYVTASSILKHWNTVPRYSDESPKRFALYLGLLTTVAITVFAVFGFIKVAIFVALILIICTFLEVLFDFCIGCKIYYALQLVKVMKHDRNFN